MQRCRNRFSLLAIIFSVIGLLFAPLIAYSQAGLPKTHAPFSFGKTEHETRNASPGTSPAFSATDEIYGFFKLDKDLMTASGQKSPDYIFADVTVEDLKLNWGQVIFLKDNFMKHWKSLKEIPFEIVPGEAHYRQIFEKARAQGREPKHWNIQNDAITEIQNRVYPIKFLQKLAELPEGTHTFLIVLKQGGFAEEPFLAAGRFTLTIDGTSKGRFSALSDKLGVVQKEFLSKQPDIDYSKIKGKVVKWSGPYLENNKGAYVALDSYGNNLYYNGGKVAEMQGDNVYRGILFVGKFHVGSYNPAVGKDIRLENITGKDALSITYGGKKIGEVLRDGTVMKRGKKWGKMVEVDFYDSTTLLRLLAIAYHYLDLFR